MLTLWLIHASAFGNTITLTPDDQELILGPHLLFIEDQQKALDLTEVAQTSQTTWQQNSTQIFNQGYSKSAFWLSFTLILSEDFASPRTYYLELDLPIFDVIDTYLFVDGEESSHTSTGLKRPPDQKAYQHESYVFPIELKPGVEYRILMRLESDSSILAPLTLFTESNFHEYNADKTSIISFYLGLSTILALTNFFIFLSIRDNSFLLYTVHVLVLCWLQMSLRGYTATYFWSNHFYSFLYYETTVVAWLSFATSLLFVIKFLKLKENQPLSNMILFSCLCIALFFAVATFILPIHLVVDIINIYSTAVLMLIIFVTVQSVKRRDKAARLFLIGWCIFLISGIVKTIYYQGWLPTNFFTLNPILIGSSLQGALFSLALADRINIIQKEKVDAQKQAVHALESSNKIKDDFLTSISHELRTPLAGIIGALSIAQDSSNKEELLNYKSLVSKSAARMSDTIDSILCLSEINSGTLKPHPIDFVFRDQIDEHIHQIRLQCQEKNISFNTVINTPRSHVYKGDINKIRLIILNLLQNAVNFTDKGHIDLSIEELNNGDQSHLDIHVRDTGTGIEKEKLNTIFEAFQQLSAGYTRSQEGLGIGLTICKSLANILNGHLSVESIQGRGTHVYVRIPISIVSTEYRNQPKENDFEAINVLIVEDNLVNQKILMSIAKKLTESVSLANNGAECLEAVAKHKPDIIFMDCQMPIMDGFEATEKLRASYSKEELPIIAVTANALSQDRERCFDAGMNDFLSKPVKIDDIKTTLNKWSVSHQSSVTRSISPIEQNTVS